MDLLYEKQKTAVLLDVTLLGGDGNSLLLCPGGVVLWDTSKPLLAHALREIEVFPPCYLVRAVRGEPMGWH